VQKIKNKCINFLKFYYKTQTCKEEGKNLKPKKYPSKTLKPKEVLKGFFHNSIEIKWVEGFGFNLDFTMIFGS
jgi:hypothetical protein